MIKEAPPTQLIRDNYGVHLLTCQAIQRLWPVFSVHY